MNKVSESVKLNVGGTLFETTADTLRKSPFLEALLRNTVLSSVLFLDEDPEIFRHLLNLLRDYSYSVPFRYRSRMAYYGFDFGESRYGDFFDLKGTDSAIKVRDEEGTARPVALETTSVTFPLLQLCAGGVQSSGLVEYKEFWGELQDHRAEGVSYYLLDPTKLNRVRLERNCDLIARLYLHLQITMNATSHSDFRLGLVFEKISFVVGDYVIADINGHELDMLLAFMNIDLEPVKTTQDGVYDIFFQLPLSPISPLKPRNHKDFLPAMKTATVFPFPLGSILPNVLLEIMLTDEVTMVAGRLVCTTILCENHSRQGLCRRAVNEKLVVPFWHTQHCSWTQSGRFQHRLRLSHLINELYVQARELSTGLLLPIEKIILVAETQVHNVLGYLLERRKGVYNLSFNTFLMNCSRIADLRIEVITRCTEEVRCRVVAIGLNSLVYKGGSCATLYA